MDLIGLTDEVILRLQLKSINSCLIEGSKKVEVKKTDYDLDRLLHFKRLDKKVMEFLDIFKENFTEEQFNAMLENLESLKIVEKKCEVPSNCIKLSLGNYDADTNTITVYYYKDKRIDKDLEDETIFHELLHMASTKKLKDGVVTGFRLLDNVGISLNEGYTELLTERHFTKKNKYVYSDSIDLFFAKGIENVIGKEKMQEFYFSANLEGLIQELSKYMKRYDVLKLIYLMDKQHTMLPSSKEKGRIIEAIARMNHEKLKQDYAHGKITYEEYQIEYTKKVEEYRNGVMWSEEAVPIIDEGLFVLYDQGDSSGVYELRPSTTKEDKNKEKTKKSE